MGERGGGGTLLFRPSPNLYKELGLACQRLSELNCLGVVWTVIYIIFTK